MARTPSWDRFDVSNVPSLAPLFRSRSCGIYVLEFANGEFYVGQTTNPTQRLTTHVRHWGDVRAILFREVPLDQLYDEEVATIEQRRAAGWKLRNIKHNPGHAQPSSLDNVLSVVEQTHWALGHVSYDAASVRQAAHRDGEQPTKLARSRIGRQLLRDGVTIADAVLHDLAAVIELAIPEPVTTERLYWTITDFPSTSGGRFATLNVGDMEMLYFPRWPIYGSKLWVVLNIAADHDIPPRISRGWVKANVRPYRASGFIDRLILPLGTVGATLRHERVLAGARELALTLMRSSTSAKFARWHSAELARRSYEIIARGERLGC